MPRLSLARQRPAPRPDPALIAAGAIDEAVVRYFMRAGGGSRNALFPPPWIGHIPFAFWLTAVRPSIRRAPDRFWQFVLCLSAGGSTFNLPTALCRRHLAGRGRPGPTAMVFQGCPLHRIPLWIFVAVPDDLRRPLPVLGRRHRSLHLDGLHGTTHGGAGFPRSCPR